MADGFGPRWISTIYAPNDQYKVLIELEPQFQKNPDVISKLYVKSSGGQLCTTGGCALAAFGVRKRAE